MQAGAAAVQKSAFCQESPTSSPIAVAVKAATGATWIRWNTDDTTHAGSPQSPFLAGAAALFSPGLAAAIKTPSRGTSTGRSTLKVPPARANWRQSSPPPREGFDPCSTVNSCDPASACTLRAACTLSESHDEKNCSSVSRPLSGTRQAVTKTPKLPIASPSQRAPATVNVCRPAFGTDSAGRPDVSTYAVAAGSLSAISKASLVSKVPYSSFSTEATTSNRSSTIPISLPSTTTRDSLIGSSITTTGNEALVAGGEIPTMPPRLEMSTLGVAAKGAKPSNSTFTRTSLVGGGSIVTVTSTCLPPSDGFPFAVKTRLFWPSAGATLEYPLWPIRSVPVTPMAATR